MKSFKNTQGSVWVAILVIIAVVIAALLLSGNFNFWVDDSIQGRVEQINYEENYLTISHIEVLSVAEDGDAEIEETFYTVIWDDEATIEPHHPDFVEVGEMVRVVPAERLEENQTLFVLKELEITRTPDLDALRNTETEETATDTPVSN